MMRGATGGAESSGDRRSPAELDAFLAMVSCRSKRRSQRAVGGAGHLAAAACGGDRGGTPVRCIGTSFRQGAKSGDAARITAGRG